MCATTLATRPGPRTQPRHRVLQSDSVVIRDEDRRRAALSLGLTLRLDFYDHEDLTKIIRRSAHLLGIPCEEAGAKLLAERSRGTPRVANRLIRRVRDFAEVEGEGKVDRRIVELTCQRLEVDAAGLDEMDRRLLSILIEHYEGGPVGVETLAAALATCARYFLWGRPATLALTLAARS